MRRTRPASPSWAYPCFSSWKSLVMTCLALSQVVTIYLLLHIASKREQEQITAILREEGNRLDHDLAAAPRPPSIRKAMRRILSVAGSSSGSTSTKKTCVPQTVSPGLCSNEARAVQRPGQNKRDTCAFDLDETEVVFGVWHSLATEDRLQPLLETWGRRAQVVLLASSVGVRNSKLFQEGVPGSRPHLLGERRDEGKPQQRGITLGLTDTQNWHMSVDCSTGDSDLDVIIVAISVHKLGVRLPLVPTVYT